MRRVFIHCFENNQYTKGFIASSAVPVHCRLRNSGYNRSLDYQYCSKYMHVYSSLSNIPRLGRQRTLSVHQDRAVRYNFEVASRTDGTRGMHGKINHVLQVNNSYMTYTYHGYASESTSCLKFIPTFHMKIQYLNPRRAESQVISGVFKVC